MRLNLGRRRGLGKILATGPLILFALLSVATGTLRGNVILNTGSPTCSGTDTGGINPVCSASASQRGADPVSGMTGMDLAFASSVTIANNSIAGAHTTVLTIATNGIAGGSGTVTAGTIIPFGFGFTLDGTTAGPNTTFTNYSVQFNISTASGIGNVAGSAFNGPVGSGAIAFPPATNFATPAGNFSGTIAVGKSINAGTNYFLTTVLTVVWNSGPGNKNITIVTPTNFSLDAWAIPEPGTLGPAVAALALFGFVRRRRQRTR